MADYLLPYEVGIGYKRKPLQNVIVNVGSDKNPVYEERYTFPPFPWRLNLADNHVDEDAKAFWLLARSAKAVPEPIPAKFKEDKNG